MNKREVKVRKWLGIMLALAMIIGMMPTAAFAEDHVHQYVDTVVEPTCTEQGYTLHKCSCGDEYKDSYTDPVPHDYGEDGYCRYGCGFFKAMAPEGATFLYVTSDEPGEIKIEKQPDYDITGHGDTITHFHIKIPEGAKGVKMVYPEDAVTPDEWGYGHATAFTPGAESAGSNITFPTRQNSDGTWTEHMDIRDYISYSPESAVKIIMRGNVAANMIEAFSFEYDLPDGYYHVIKPQGTKYTITGDDKATNGYKFTVTPVEGYTPGPNFAVKVNGKVVAKEPGEITLDEVEENVFIIIEDADVTVKLDLAKWNAPIIEKSIKTFRFAGYDIINEDEEADVDPGKMNELSFMTDSDAGWSLILQLDGGDNLSNKIIGWNINGTVYNGYGQDIEGYDGVVYMDSYDYHLSFNFEWTDWDAYRPDKELAAMIKGTYVVKPVFECDEHDYAPATCLEPETCTKCNMPKEGSTPDTENGHSWDEGKVTKEATIGAAGEMTYRCEHNAAHTKKEEIPQVDATELNGLISDAETKAAEEIAISDNGEGLEIGTKFVSQADKDAFEEAIAAAKLVASSDDSTESDVYGAYLALGEAIDEYDWSTQVFTDLMDAENKVDALPKEIKTSDKEAVEAARKALEAVDKEAESFDQDYYDYVETKLGAAEAKLDAAEAKEELEKVKKDADASKEAEKQAAEKAAKAEEAQKAAEKKLAEAENAKAESVGKVALKKVKGAKKKVTVTWKKVNGAKGYEVIVAKNKKGTKNALTYNVKGNKAKKVVKKLKKGKYFVKVRAYKQYNGEMLYGGWSKAKKVKVK